MMNATELRICNYIGCRVSNDHGIYQVWGIDGYERRYDKEDSFVTVGKRKYNTGKKFLDYRLVRIFGGARDNEKYPEDKLKPLKLTEEWFQKFGFKSIAKGHYVKYEWGDFYEFAWNIYDKELRYRSNVIIPIKYVHQLQNLYFALTGKELTIN